MKLNKLRISCRMYPLAIHEVLPTDRQDERGAFTDLRPTDGSRAERSLGETQTRLDLSAAAEPSSAFQSEVPDMTPSPSNASFSPHTTTINHPTSR